MSGLTIVKLRPHHLLCILTYIGKGYSEGFVANFNDIVKALNAGAHIKLIKGPDDICAGCTPTSADYHCQDDDITEQDRQALTDIKALFPDIIKENQPFILGKDAIIRLRQAFAQKQIRNSCQGCPWYDLCSEISQSHYEGTLLR